MAYRLNVCRLCKSNKFHSNERKFSVAISIDENPLKAMGKRYSIFSKIKRFLLRCSGEIFQKNTQENEFSSLRVSHKVEQTSTNSSSTFMGGSFLPNLDLQSNMRKLSTNLFFLILEGSSLQYFLRNMEGIVALNVEKRPPCNRLIVAAWEQNNDVALPPDLREFYASTDGFEMSWKYQNCNQRENKESENITVEGEIKISALTHVKPLHFAHKQRIKHQSAANRLKVNQKSKSLNIGENAWNQNNNFKMAFVLSSHANVGTVCLVYHNDKEPSHPTASTHAAPPSSIWLLDTGNNWHFLAEDFSSYFRMMLIHVGLQNWQLKFTSQGLTTSCRRAASLILPHLFHEDNTDEASKWEMTPNVINSNVFKSSQSNSKSSKSTPVKSKHGSHHKVKKN